ncbi:flagellar basal body rod protein FlgC [Planctomycetales bacterium ZRK34]|nr:flagellar basal body rod protein FlgC [Planctomycetales bacterium ZRK34]
MFGALDVSTSALVANRTRLNVIAANMANQFSVENADGEYAPYRRRVPIFASGDPARGSSAGVHVAEIELDQAAFRKKYEPGHKFADADGYVEYPNIDPAIEQVNALEASRAYEANITAVEATKSMLNAAMRLIA